MNENKRGIKVPHELHGIPVRAIEEYVRARIVQFAKPFARRCNPELSGAAVQRAASEAIADLPLPEYGSSPVEDRDLQLVFRHDCLSLGCLDPQCVLCEHNPQRRCNVNFAPKYLVSDVLRAKCEAPIRVEIIDRATGIPVGEDIPNVHLQMAIMDGNAYDSRCMEGALERDSDLDTCTLLVNNKDMALLAPGGGAAHDGTHHVVVRLMHGVAQLPDLHVSDSSEAMLSGRKPPFRLLVRAVHDEGRRISVRHAVSEGFVVATRRTRTAGKVEIPNVDDHVGKLEHMGKETVKKLQDVRNSGRGFGVDISIPCNCINKVGEFRKLALMAEGDGHLRQKLQQVLKLSKEKWDEARDHAMRAVVADNRMRIWYSDMGSGGDGLLFTCRLGNIDLDRPVGLLQKKAQEGAQTTMEATLMAQQTPQQREQVRLLQPQAVASWWQAGHPGWAIYPVDSDHFMSTGALTSSVEDSEDGRGGGVNGFASPTAGCLEQGPGRLRGGAAISSRLGGEGDTQYGSRKSAFLTSPVTDLPSLMEPLGTDRPGSLGDLKLTPSSTSMLNGGSLGESGTLNLSSFQSADLEHLVSHYPQAESLGTSGSFGLGAFGGTDSMELPDVPGYSGAGRAGSAAAMLHDVPGGQHASIDATLSAVPKPSSGDLPPQVPLSPPLINTGGGNSPTDNY